MIGALLIPHDYCKDKNILYIGRTIALKSGTFFS